MLRVSAYQGHQKGIVNFFVDFDRQYGLHESACTIQREMQHSGWLASLAGRPIFMELQVLPDAEDDAFFTFIVNLLTEAGPLDESLSTRIACRVLDDFFRHIESRHDPDAVENVRGYLLGCEIRVNGRPTAVE